MYTIIKIPKSVLIITALYFLCQNNLSNAATSQEPLPYASIAIPFDDYEKQKIRDSANMKISRIRVNQAGYRQQDKKYFYYIANNSVSDFKVITTSGISAGSGTLISTDFSTAGKIYVKASNNALTVSGGDTAYTMESPEIAGTIYEGLLPELPKGKYHIVVNNDTSSSFTVDDHLYSWVRDALLKFYGINRCGDSHSWFHPPCHVKDEVTGGWHDGGDHLKEGVSIGYTAAVLGLTAAVFKDHDHDVYNSDQSKTNLTDGIPDILYEAKHGADYILQSYEKANGQVGEMITSIGNFGYDHNHWGRPEKQDTVPVERGGQPRAARKELGANILGYYAANLAFVSRLIKKYNSSYSERALTAAKDIYAFAKAHSDSASSSFAYNGINKTYDKLALAAVALIYATGDKAYLNDLCFDKAIGKRYNPNFPKFSYEGGWFAKDNPDFVHYTANTDWASAQMYASWGFFRLVLMDEELCSVLGLSDSQRKALIEKTIYSIAMNLGYIGITGDLTISLPSNGLMKDTIKIKLPWRTMNTLTDWSWNSYHAGNITDMFCYYDVASRIQGMDLPNTPASANWKADEIKSNLVRMLDYLFGVNPWDICMINGIGSKNFNHPHHRASNPELRNSIPEYEYHHPVGALFVGINPVNTLYSDVATEYRHSEICISSTTALFLPVCGMSTSDDYTHIPGKLNVNKRAKSNFLITPQKGGKGFVIKSVKSIASVTVFTLTGQVIGKYTFPNNHLKSVILHPIKMSRYPGNFYIIQVMYADGDSMVKRINAVWK